MHHVYADDNNPAGPRGICRMILPKSSQGGGKSKKVTEAEGSVIWLHDRGQTGELWGGLLPSEKFKKIRMVCPTAELCHGSTGWFDMAAHDEKEPRDEAALAEATARVYSIIEAEKKAGVKENKIVLAGFGQGGAVCLHVALRGEFDLAGVVVLCYYPSQ